MSDILTDAWQPRTDAERYEQTWIVPKQHLNIPIQNGYQHQPYESADSRHFVSDTHPEDTWN